MLKKKKTYLVYHQQRRNFILLKGSKTTLKYNWWYWKPTPGKLRHFSSNQILVLSTKTKSSIVSFTYALFSIQAFISWDLAICKLCHLVAVTQPFLFLASQVLRKASHCFTLTPVPLLLRVKFQHHPFHTGPMSPPHIQLATALPYSSADKQLGFHTKGVL